MSCVRVKSPNRPGDLPHRYAIQRQEERVSKKHIHKSIQQLADRKGQQERYRDNSVVTRKGERFIKAGLKVDVSLDPGPGCELGGIIGWRTKQGRRGLGIKKMTKEEADKVCISNKTRKKAISSGDKKVVFENKLRWSKHTAGSMVGSAGGSLAKRAEGGRTTVAPAPGTCEMGRCATQRITQSDLPSDSSNGSLCSIEDMASQPCKRRRLSQEDEAKELRRLLALDAVEALPEDFGGRLASMLWDVEVQHFSKVEYIHLLFGGGLPKDKRTRKLVTPELYSLARCSRSVRRGLIAAAEARRMTIEEASTEERKQVETSYAAP
ncbi:unnamed protein product [Effrenium voratum]|nr:unnamed protein product [Effrenium voratum]